MTVDVQSANGPEKRAYQVGVVSRGENCGFKDLPGTGYFFIKRYPFTHKSIYFLYIYCHSELLSLRSCIHIIHIDNKYKFIIHIFYSWSKPNSYAVFTRNEKPRKIETFLPKHLQFVEKERSHLHVIDLSSKGLGNQQFTYKKNVLCFLLLAV